MALMGVVSGITAVDGAQANFSHNLGNTPDIVIPVQISGGALSGTIQAVPTGSINNSIFRLASTVGSISFNALCIKFHSIVR